MTSFDETLSLELRTRPLPVTHVQVDNCRSYGRSRHGKPRVTRQKQTLPSTTLPIYVRRTATRGARAGTTYAACTAASATVRRSSSRTCMRKIKAYRRAGCPSPGSVAVVTGDPPPGRGQPAIQPYREVPHCIELNCKSIRRTGSTSDTLLPGNRIVCESARARRLAKADAVGAYTPNQEETYIGRSRPVRGQSARPCFRHS
ncbi:hypothetical protein B0G69_7882 [Paraburkholderia sp. RAU2J]|nr:hypothetical protein B0G69_7882 [Paraburkholderia sp. RAU2J]